MLDLLKDNGDPAKAILINPNNGAIDTRYDPDGIDDPFTYRARNGFMSIGDLWAGGGGTVYMQGHLVIPNPWGDAVTNGTTTTTTTDTTAKGGGDDIDTCGGPCPPNQTVLCDCYYRGAGVVRHIGSVVGGDCPDKKWMESSSGVIVEGKLDHKKCYCVDYFPM